MKTTLATRFRRFALVLMSPTARQFVAFLQSAEGHAIFRSNGWE